MNKISAICAALVFALHCPSFSQCETVFHYPLNIGDLWEYREYWLGASLTRKVLGDTLLPNGKVFRIIEEYSPPYGTKYFYQRLNDDSTEVFQFYARDEFLLYKLNIKVGDRWKIPIPGSDSATFQVTQIADTTLWSNTFKFAFIFSPEAFLLEFILVDSIGIVYEGFEGGYLELQGAIIKNKRFGIFTSVHSFENNPPENTILNSNAYPNPFNSFTAIEYRLNNTGWVRITIFNVLGERVKLLNDSFQTPGLYRRKWSGENESGELVASGIYIYTIEVNDVIIVRKAILFLK